MLKRASPAADHCTVTGTRASAAHRAEDGVSLVEVMVAMGVFVVASLSLLSVLSTSMAGTFDNRARVTAAQVAASDIDTARAKGAGDYYGLASDTYDRVVDGRTYTVTRTVAPTLSTGATSSCIGSGSARQLYKRVTTRVTTPRARMRPVRADTMVKAPVYDPNSSTGAIALVVIDRAGGPLAGLPADAGGINRTTDANGCAFFDGLPAGTHTATVTKPGHVTIAGSTALSRQVTVNAGQITSQVLRIDKAITLTVNASRCCTEPLSKFARPNGASISLASPDRTSATRVDYPTQPVVGGDQTWSVFPNPSGYEAWLGPCQPPKRIASEPGTAPVGTLKLSTITVQLTGTNASAGIAGNRGVKVLWKGSTCNEVLTFNAATDPSCKPSFDGVSGCYVHVAVPAGTWRLEVDGYPQYGVQGTVAEGTSYSVKIPVP